MMVMSAGRVIVGSILFRMRRPASATSPGGASATAAAFLVRRLLPDQNDLEADLLESKLVTGATQKLHRSLRRLVGGAQLDADRLAEQVGEVFLHLPVEDEGDIGVQLLLKLEELELPVLPGARLEHGEHEEILAGVMGKGVEHPRPLNPGTGGRAILAGQIFAEGNHT